MVNRLDLISIAVTTCALVGCLPIDTSPPAQVTIELSASELSATIPAARTSDGWEVGFSRLLLTVHTVSLHPVNDTGCDSTVSGYARILSLLRPERQRVAMLFASGSCGFDYEVAPFAGFADVVLAPGVTPADTDAMFDAAPAFLAEASDDELGTTWRQGLRAPGLYVEGHATRAAEQKHFQWMFWDVSPPEGAFCPPGLLRGLNLESDDRTTVELFARGETLFAQSPDADILAFDEFANADAQGGDNDGWISQAELRQARSTSDELSLQERVVARLRSQLTSATADWACLTAASWF